VVLFVNFAHDLPVPLDGPQQRQKIESADYLMKAELTQCPLPESELSIKRSIADTSCPFTALFSAVENRFRRMTDTRNR
jgi:hypothetical protein